MRLLEVLNNPLPYKIREDENGNFVAAFDAHQREYLVTIEEIDDGNWTADMTNEETGIELMHSGENALRVLATVIAIIRAFMREHDKDIQRLGITSRDESTNSLYTSVLKHEALPAGWHSSVSSVTGGESILLINDNYKKTL